MSSILTHSTTSPIMPALLLSWNSLQDEAWNLSFDDDLGKDKIQLLHHPLWNAGFEEDGKIPQVSVTKQLTIDIELLREIVQRQKIIRNNTKLNINKREHLAYLQNDFLSIQFITVLPDVLEILTDLVILEAFHQYIGIHSPAMILLLHWPTSSGGTVIRPLLTNTGTPLYVRTLGAATSLGLTNISRAWWEPSSARPGSQPTLNLQQLQRQGTWGKSRTISQPPHHTWRNHPQPPHPRLPS